jgi:hypothetical protein
MITPDFAPVRGASRMPRPTHIVRFVPFYLAFPSFSELWRNYDFDIVFLLFFIATTSRFFSLFSHLMRQICHFYVFETFVHIPTDIVCDFFFICPILPSLFVCFSFSNWQTRATSQESDLPTQSKRLHV